MLRLVDGLYVMRGIETHVRAAGRGEATPRSTLRDYEGGSHMSQGNSTGVRRTGLGVSIAGGAAIAAAMFSMGTAHAVIPPDGTEDNPFINTDTGGYSELFGGTGTVQGPDDATIDSELIAQNPGDATAFSDQVGLFETNVDNPLTSIIQSIDPNAFVWQSTAGIDDGAAYLVPDDSLGYDATFLDFFLLQPTGLGDLLGPLGDILLGSAF